MFVMIQGVKREGFGGVWRNQRFWSSSEAKRVEVVDTEPPMVEEDVFTDGRKTGTRLVADMTKISKASLDELREDGRVSIFADGETQDGISKAEVDAARRSAAESASRATALQAENAGLRERIAELEAVIASAKSAAEEPAEHVDNVEPTKRSSSKR
jgi:hypothetical protein